MRVNFLDLFEKTVERFSEKDAVIENNGSITFLDLKEKSQKTACSLLKRLGMIKNRPIAVFLNKSIQAVTANIGITYSGNIFMNIDTKIPMNRLQNICAVIKPAAIITNKKEISKLQGISEDILILTIEELWENDSTCEFIDTLYSIHKKVIDTDPWCIINTSGSTGTPKGVALNSRNLFDFLDWSLDNFHFTEDQIIGSLSPIVFDIYIYEITLMMAKGATIVFLDAALAVFPIKLLQRLKETHVNYIFWVPSIMVNIANMDLLSKIALPDLKIVWFAGEVFPTRQYNYWHHHLPQTKFVNLYGPIETALDSIYFIIDREFSDEEALPIGYACQNTGIYLLTEDNKEAEVGEEGEICVRGSSLALGYYNNPEKTAAAFVQNPLNTAYPETIYRTGDIGCLNERGEILFKGRKDSLIKHMGYRIELSEIEHVIINKLKFVEYCCVVYNRCAKEITLIYESPQELPVSEIRAKLSKEFPKYMLPVAFHHMEHLPRNTNGKIDRLSLSKMVNQDA